MPKRNVYMMLSLVLMFGCGIGAYMLWGSSPVLGKVVLAVGFIGFFMMVISNIVLKRK